MSKRYIRFGIIGCGLMGREFASATARWAHLLDFDVAPRIVGICDTNPAMLRWFSDSLDTIHIATQDYTDLLNSPDIDAIYCAVPHNLHEQFYIRHYCSRKAPARRKTLRHRSSRQRPHHRSCTSPSRSAGALFLGIPILPRRTADPAFHPRATLRNDSRGTGRLSTQQ